MNPLLKWGGGAAGALLALALLGASYDYVASEAIIARNYQPRSVAFHAPSDRAAIARGAHLAVVTGCTDCHRADLTGQSFDDVPDSTIWSRNLTILAHEFSDTDFERAIRQGIRPDGHSVVIMPSNAYAAMSDRDLGDIVAYLRTLKPKGQATPEPRYGLMLRAGLIMGKLKSNRDYAKDDKPSLDLGARYAAGRNLAAVACAECHQTNFTPRPDQFFATPDLSLVASYEKADFVKLMRTGKAAGDREVGFMSITARKRFSHFTDAEIDALYDYLAARGRKLTGMDDVAAR
jgi:mono/diheme cytochrome c family protein